MSIRAALFLLALTVAIVVGVLAGATAALLAYFAGAHPASAVARGGVAFAGTLTLEVVVAGLACTVLNQ